MKHPRQPLIVVKGVVRFKENPIVTYLLDAGPIDMNQLAMMSARGSVSWTRDDRAHFAQLIGYSASGYGDLSYVSRVEAGDVDRLAAELMRRKNS